MGYNINNYKRLGEPEEKENFEDYAKDFENSFPLYLLQKITKVLSTDDSNIIFMGYGKENLFPQIFDTCIGLTDGKLSFYNDRTEIFKVSHLEYAHISVKKWIRQIPCSYI